MFVCFVFLWFSFYAQFKYYFFNLLYRPLWLGLQVQITTAALSSSSLRCHIFLCFLSALLAFISSSNPLPKTNLGFVIYREEHEVDSRVFLNSQTAQEFSLQGFMAAAEAERAPASITARTPL